MCRTQNNKNLTHWAITNTCCQILRGIGKGTNNILVQKGNALSFQRTFVKNEKMDAYDILFPFEIYFQ